jgi:hypothetical protein
VGKSRGCDAMFTLGVAEVAHRWAYPPLPPKAIISPLLEKAHVVIASPSVSICSRQQMYNLS